ncbi:MAG: sigma-54-dependent Fis family transcriptional regulator [Desulfobacteraceae bacterium]|nr:sigma-54-dependent Fis family transcriptional regulator [Desulfobacteraceae bacterium]
MPGSIHILVVDDEDTICEALSAWLTKEGYRVKTAGSGHEALALMQQARYDLYLVDIKMPGMDGIELLAEIKKLQPDASVIMITAHGSIQTAVEAMKLGGTDYLCKPFDPEQLSLLLERVTAARALREENTALREQLLESNVALLDGFVAQSAVMQDLLVTLEEIAPSSSSVLIIGETGVGKDLVARIIHMRSEQASGPFIAINCGAQSETLLESELFGHERGAFTGAVKARRGRLEMADNGTLFLDEIGEISSRMQVSLLRVLEEKNFQRLGGSQSIETNFRLICATHRDLQKLIKQEKFREDFYYRINVLMLKIPPLRERVEDIPVLADYFLERYVRETGKPIEGLTQKAIDILTTYYWPGNVRELRNVIERAVVIARGRTISADELAFLQHGSNECRLGVMTLKEMEIRHLLATLQECKWNVSQAARQLNIDRVTLTRKIKRYGLKPAQIS